MTTGITSDKHLLGRNEGSCLPFRSFVLRAADCSGQPSSFTKLRIEHLHKLDTLFECKPTQNGSYLTLLGGVHVVLAKLGEQYHNAPYNGLKNKFTENDFLLSTEIVIDILAY